MAEETRHQASATPQVGRHSVWRPRGNGFDAQRYRDTLLAIFEAVRAAPTWDADSLPRILAQHPRKDKPMADDEHGFFSKIELVTAYQQLTALGELPFERHVLRRLQMKPVRTASGVAPVTVLTQPAGCPGRCIFCPDAEGMPKSYLPDEPGARRAAQCGFDPYLQVRTRLATFHAMGHAADKVELLILGGTWSAYPKTYREWFIRRCFDAMNEPLAAEGLPPAGVPAEPMSHSGAGGQTQKAEPVDQSAALAEAQAHNETAPHRNVGLVIETRPDWVTPAEIAHLRQLGVTKIQLGVQSLDDRILALNRRGHDVDTVRRAVRMLRAAGFKLHLHWMPNLFGATPESDRADFARLWDDPALRPDELKIYPCSIIAGTELYRLWQAGHYRPYTDEELIALVADCKATIPPYCRVNRVFRDIPADDIVAGSKRSNLRQLVHEHLAATGRRCGCIRCREVRAATVEEKELQLVRHVYATDTTEERFLSFETDSGRLAGFLRLSLPGNLKAPAAETAAVWAVMPEIADAAMIREVHVYGPALGIGAENAGEAQHLGLGRRLIAQARDEAREAGFSRLAVIAAIGTRRYYERLGFQRSQRYMIAAL
ncbi:MAG: elongator complex protein 3 [Anaerolineae bacterium]